MLEKLRDPRLAPPLNIGNSSGKVRRRRPNVPALYELEGSIAMAAASTRPG